MAESKFWVSLYVYINAAFPTTNFFGGCSVGYVTDKMEKRALMRQDFSAGGYYLEGDVIPEGSTITAATLYFYVSGLNYHASSEYWGQRIRTENRDWVINQCTWNIYKTANNWGTAGCYSITTDRDTAVVSDDRINPDALGWWALDVTTLMQDALANRNRVFDMLLHNSYLPLEDEQADINIIFGEPSELIAYISVTYTPPAGAAPKPRMMIF